MKLYIPSHFPLCFSASSVSLQFIFHFSMPIKGESKENLLPLSCFKLADVEEEEKPDHREVIDQVP
jgi:hypothetical protein